MVDRLVWLAPLVALGLLLPERSPYAPVPAADEIAGLAALALAALPWRFRRRPRLGIAALIAAAPWLHGAVSLLRASLGDLTTYPYDPGLPLQGPLEDLAVGAEVSGLLLAALAMVALTGPHRGGRPRPGLALAAGLGLFALTRLDDAFEAGLFSPAFPVVAFELVPGQLLLGAIGLAALRGASRDALVRSATLAATAVAASALAGEARLHAMNLDNAYWREGFFLPCGHPHHFFPDHAPHVLAMERGAYVVLAVAGLAAVTWLARGRLRAVLGPALVLGLAVGSNDAAMYAMGQTIEANEVPAALPFVPSRGDGAAYYFDGPDLEMRRDGSRVVHRDPAAMLAVEAGTPWRHVAPLLDHRSDLGVLFVLTPTRALEEWRPAWAEELRWFAHVHPTPRYAVTAIPWCAGARRLLDTRRIRVDRAGGLHGNREPSSRPYELALAPDPDATLDVVLRAAEKLGPVCFE